MERRGHAALFPRAARLVLPDRGVHELPRLLRPRRGRRLCRQARGRGPRCDGGPGPGLLDARLVRRPAARRTPALARPRRRRDRLPRARAPALLSEGRQRLQRGLCDRGGGGGRRALARAARRLEGGRGLAGRAAAPPPIHRPAARDPRRAGRALRIGSARRRDAGGQGSAVRRAAPPLCRPAGVVERGAGVRPVDGAAAQQRAARGRRDLPRAAARVPRAIAVRRWRPAGVLRGGRAARRAAAGGTRPRIRNVLPQTAGARQERASSAALGADWRRRISAPGAGCRGAVSAAAGPARTE